MANKPKVTSQAGTSAGTSTGVQSGTQTGTQAQTGEQNPFAPAVGNLKDILAKAKAIGNDGTFNPTFSNNTVGGLNALGDLGRTPSAAATALQPVVQGSGQGYQTGLGALQQTAGGGLIGGNQYLDGVLKNANQKTADSVNAQFSNAGRYGSGAQTTALTDQIGRQNTEALSNQYNIERQNQLGAAGTLSSQGLQGAQAASGIDAAKQGQVGLQIQAGQGQDQIADAKRLAPYQASLAEAGLSNPIAALGSSTTGTAKTTGKTGGTTGGTTSGTTTGSGSEVQQSNPLTTGLGLGISALSLFSDERMKENVREVGKTHDGQKIYSYNYKGSPTPTMGLLAHQVEKKHPEAVSEHGGMKAVNYREATKDAARGKVKKPSLMGKMAG